MTKDKRKLWRLGGLLLGLAALLTAFAPAAHAQTKAKPKVLTVLDETKIDKQGPVHVVAFSSDGRFLAETDDNVHVWDLSEKEPKKYADLETRIAFGAYGLAFSPDGKWLVIGGADHNTRFWDMTATPPKEAYKLKDHVDNVNTIAFSPDGKLMASGGDDRAVLIWDVEGDKPKVKDTLRIDDAKREQHQVRWVAFSPNGKRLAVACRNGLVRTYDVSGGQVKPAQLYPLEKVHNPHITFSPDNRVLAVSGDKVVRLIGANFPLAGHTERTRSVAFAPDGKSLASVGEDGRIVLWDMTTGKALINKEKPGKFTSVAFAPLPAGAKPDAEMTLAASLESGGIWVLKLGYKDP